MDEEYLVRVAKALKFIEGLDHLDGEQLFELEKILRGENEMRALEDSVKKDDIEVGDYVKTRNGCAGEVISVNDFRPPETKYCLDIGADDLVFCGEKDIVRHGKKVEDIINEKDALEILNDYANDFYTDNEYPYLVEAIRDIMYLYTKEKGE